jgi:hypothetical protein
VLGKECKLVRLSAVKETVLLDDEVHLSVEESELCQKHVKA